jgi:hypothetical protein
MDATTWKIYNNMYILDGEILQRFNIFRNIRQKTKLAVLF